MRFAEVTLVVELSEELSDAAGENKLMDDIHATLVNSSEFVVTVRSINIKDCTKECEVK